MRYFPNPLLSYHPICPSHAKGFVLAATILILTVGCSQLPSAPELAPTQTSVPAASRAPTFSPTPTVVPAPVVYRPNPTPTSLPTPVRKPTPTPPPIPPAGLWSQDQSHVVEGIESKCFYMGTTIPKVLMSPLAEVVNKHTRRYVITGDGTMRIEPGYIHAEDDHAHPFLTHMTPPKRPTVSSDTIPWTITLYGAKWVFLLYGDGMWELRADVTLDPETCDATLEKLVAGPDEIVLYP